jgi:hypothetical protein
MRAASAKGKTVHDMGRQVAAFLRLWFVLLFAYVLVRFLLNLVVLGFVDARWNQVPELLVVPLGQSIIFWLISRRRHG